MKFTRFFLTLGLLITQQVILSQTKNVTFKTELTLEDVNCDNNDVISRNIEIKMFYNNSFNTVQKLESKKCMDTYVIPRYKGEFKALISVTNYIPTEIKFEINDTSDTIYLKAILHRSDIPKVLNEIVISGTANTPIKVEGNKTTYSVTNNDGLNNGTALETIQKLPGVLTDLNGNITLKGKTVTVYVDGLPTNMDGQDLTNYLNSISSSTVSKVEIVNNPGASFDANTASDVINVLTTKKNKRGINGTLYSATNVYRKQKYQNSLSLNGLYDKVNWNLNLGYSDIEYESGANKFILDKDNNSISDNSLNNVFYKPFTLKTGFGFPIKNSNIDFRYSFSNINQETIGHSDFLSNDNSVITHQTSDGNQRNKSDRNEFTTNFIHKFKNPEQVFSLNHQFYTFNRNINSVNNSVLENMPYDNLAANRFKAISNKIKGDLVLPFTPFRVNTGFKVGNSEIISKGNYYNSISNNTNQINFDYKDITTALYAEVFKKYNKYDFTAGVRYEYINIESETNNVNNQTQKFSNIFPSFNVGYTMNPMASVNLSYAKKVKLPGYQELDPNTSGIPNNLVTETGNPLLNPSFSNNFELKFSFLKAGYLSFTYSEANTENYAVVVKENNTFKQTIEQFENIKNFGASFGMPIPLGIITKGMAYAKNITDINNIDYVFLFSGINHPTYTNEGYNNDSKSLYYVGAASQFILPLDTKMNLNYLFSSTGNYTIYSLDKSFYKFDLTLTKSLLKKSMKIQFAFSDIFNSANGINGSLNNNDLNLKLKTLNDSQRIKFSITYNFGTYKAEKANIKDDIDERESKKSSLDIKL